MHIYSNLNWMHKPWGIQICMKRKKFSCILIIGGRKKKQITLFTIFNGSSIYRCINILWKKKYYFSWEKKNLSLSWWTFLWNVIPSPRNVCEESFVQLNDSSKHDDVEFLVLGVVLCSSNDPYMHRAFPTQKDW